MLQTDALREAGWAGDLASVQALVAQEVDTVNDYTSLGGWTPLLAAALNGHIAVAEALLRAGAAVSQRSHSHRTALMWAAGRGHVEVAELLLQYGADARLQDRDGKTALDEAKRLKRGPVVALLESWGPRSMLQGGGQGLGMVY